jgi:hypothetical protein
VFLPVQYNTIAPKVSSMTTNGGKYRYNPNLYADGVSTPVSLERADPCRKSVLVYWEPGKDRAGDPANPPCYKS